MKVKDAEELRFRILALTQDFEYEYMGRYGSIIPINHHDISVSFEEDNYDFDNIDDALNAKIIMGKSLNEIADKITFI